MLDAPGAGLAAPQIGVGLRVFTYQVDDVVGHLVNPTLDLSDEEQDGDEGCLSIPGLTFDTKRALRVVAKGLTMHGEPVTIEGSELLARCVQHETDHLDGILFIDRLDPPAQGGDEGDPRGATGSAWRRAPRQVRARTPLRLGAVGTDAAPLRRDPRGRRARRSDACWPPGTRSSRPHPARRPGRAAAARWSPSPVAERGRGAASRFSRPAHAARPRVPATGCASSPRTLPVVAYGGLIPPAALDIPRTAGSTCTSRCCRPGGAPRPVQHAIMAGDEVTGASTFRLERAGHRAGLRLVTETIRPTDTAGDLLARLAEAGAGLLVATLDGIEAGTCRRAQPADGVTLAPKIQRRGRAGALERPALAVDRLVRGCTPAPGAWTSFRGERLKLGPSAR